MDRLKTLSERKMKTTEGWEATLDSSDGKAYGLLSAVIEFVDHQRGANFFCGK